MSNLETVRTMLACFSAGDPQGQLDRCTDDVVYEAPYYGLERHGKAALAAGYYSGVLRWDGRGWVQDAEASKMTAGQMLISACLDANGRTGWILGESGLLIRYRAGTIRP